MKYKTIVIINIKPVDSLSVKQFGYDKLLSLGFDVEILNLFGWIYKDKLNSMKGYDIIYPTPNIKQKVIYNENDFRQALEDINGSKIVFYMATRNSNVLRVLKEIDIPYMTQFTMGGVHGFINVRFRERIKNALKKLINSPAVFIKKYLKNKNMVRHEKEIYPPVYHITMHNNDRKLFDKRTKIIINHSFDYDRYIRNKSIPKPKFIPDKDYVLLLTNHNWKIHDNALDPNRTNKLIRKSEYKKLILNFLSKVSKLVNKELIIAGHPLATEEENIYEGYKFILGADTEQLAKYSSAVFGHYTGAFNFAILHKKPINLISFRKMHDDVFFDLSMKIYAEALNTRINFVDTDEECMYFVKKQIFKKNNVDYEGYIKKYIKAKDISDADNRLYWDRVYDVFINSN